MIDKKSSPGFGFLSNLANGVGNRFPLASKRGLQDADLSLLDFGHHSD
jgi:hypothetical protein